MTLAKVGSKASQDETEVIQLLDEDVVEIGILLPANRAADLIRIARSRRESVGHMIRKLIDVELAASRCSG